MTQFIILGGIIGAFILGGVYWIVKRALPKGEKEEDSQSMLLLQKELHDVRRMLDDRLGESSKLSQHQFTESAKIIREVTERLTKLDETNKQVVGFADQIQKLQDILRSPKQRGVVGEFYLETLLGNALTPKDYKMQYEFKDGKKVDAVIFVGEKIIPIDSKFSLENYNRIVEEGDPARRGELEKLFKQDLKNRIDETAKYIRPAESTKEILKNVASLERHLRGYQDYMKKLGGSLGTTVNAFNFASKEFKKIDKDIVKIGGEGMEFETSLLDKPSMEDEDTL